MFYQKIEQMCASKGITLRELERGCGFGNGLIGKWRDGLAKPSLVSINAIAEFFGCDLHELVDIVLKELKE